MFGRVGGRSAHMTSANRCPKHGPASLHVCGTFQSDGEAIGISWDKTIASGCEVLQCCETRRMEDVFVRGQTRVIRESAGRAQGEAGPDKPTKTPILLEHKTLWPGPGMRQPCKE